VDFLLEQFIEEAREQLSYLEENIESLQYGDSELLNSVFRAAHTLKGGAGIVNFTAVQDITHKAEDLLDYLRSGKIEFKESITSALFEAFDEVTTLIDAAYEEGDIVSGDKSRISDIENSLLTQMGVSDSDSDEAQGSSEFKPPFKIGENRDYILSLNFDFLSRVEQLKFKESIDSDNLDDKRLYAIELDIDERCMVYGNDPLYALSLFENELVAIYSCLNEEGAKYTLSGLDDEDGLNLRLRLIAFVDSRWSDIENNLYNFIDDIYLYPLDIESMLNITGERQEIPPLKDLYDGVKDSIQNGDKNQLNLHILNMIPLISAQSIQAKILNRFISILPFIDSSDLKGFDPLFKNLWRDSDSVEETALEEAEPKESIESEEPQSSSESSEPQEQMEQSSVTNEQDIDRLKDILEQQRYQLEHIPTSETKEMVSRFLKNIEWILPKKLPDSFNSIQELKHFLKTVLNSEMSPVQTSSAEQTIKTSQKAEPQEIKKEPQPVDDFDENMLIDDNTLISDDMFFDENALISDDGVVSDGDSHGSEKKKKPSKKESEEKVEGKQHLSKMVKIEQQTIDKLMNLVGELLVAKNSLPYLVDSINSMNKEEIKRGILEKYTSINRLSSQLQDLTMSMRMLPISYIFDRYPRLVRDMSKKLDKKVKLSIDGKETKLDKNMIEVLSEPLLHIMRNSLDHGIESVEDRVAKGKPEEGHISIKAFPQSDKIIIEVRDDGKGIDVERVVNKVLERGLMPVDEIEKLNSSEKLNLIFLPGLSTTDETSEYSGRGVGMDAVNKAINSFGGTIELESIPNQKTTIRLSIPSSLAVTALLHISMSGVHYGFPMDSVSETVKIDESDIRYLHNEPFIYIRGEVIPLIIIEEMLNMEEIKGQTLSIVVLNIKGNLLAVVVNELLGQLDVVQKPFDGILDAHPLLSGTALLGNGQIIMSIDPMGLFSLSNSIKKNRL
jgi:two-component system chemotaxis sensor kinase CheA